jgi:hypothetical protein
MTREQIIDYKQAAIRTRDRMDVNTVGAAAVVGAQTNVLLCEILLELKEQGLSRNSV